MEFGVEEPTISNPKKVGSEMSQFPMKTTQKFTTAG
jgi:hypothetical protein